jgi:hypothetical protein
VGTSQWRCRECGTVNEPDSRECRNCGHWPSVFELQDSASDESAPEVFDVPPFRDPPAIDPDVFESPDVRSEVEGPAPPAVEERPPAQRRRRIGSALGIAVFLIVLVLNLVNSRRASGEIEPVTSGRIAKTAGVTSSPFRGSRACDVYVVPVDRPSEERALNLAAALMARAPVRACTTPSFELHDDVLDHARSQVDAGRVVDLLAEQFRAAWSNRPSTILGLTELDLFLPARPEWQFAFGTYAAAGGHQGFGIVSTARLGTNEVGFGRLEIMGMRYVGFLYFGLPQSADPNSALYATILSVNDVDRMQPQFSDPSPTGAELRAARERFLDARS